MSNAEQSAKFLERLEFHNSAIESEDIASTKTEDFTFDPLYAPGRDSSPEDDLFEDAPTRGRMSRTYDLLKHRIRNSVVHSESFRDLGFDETLSATRALTEVDSDEFVVFITSAISKLPKKRTNLLERMLRLFRDEEFLPIEAYANNASYTSGIVELKHGKSNSQLLYASAENALFVNVFFNDKLTLHAKTSVEDAEAFSSKIVAAFEGHAEYAMVVLKSMRSVFISDSRRARRADKNTVRGHK
jgi:hypothetical protein